MPFDLTPQSQTSTRLQADVGVADAVRCPLQVRLKAYVRASGWRLQVGVQLALKGCALMGFGGMQGRGFDNLSFALLVLFGVVGLSLPRLRGLRPEGRKRRHCGLIA